MHTIRINRGGCEEVPVKTDITPHTPFGKYIHLNNQNILQSKTLSRDVSYRREVKTGTRRASRFGVG